MSSIVSTQSAADARPFSSGRDTKYQFDKHLFVYAEQMALHYRPASPRPGQRSFDDLGTSLSETTFCVVDLETTGTSSAEDEICEIGAVRVRGGEVLGTFSTFVCPPVPIPGRITVLTGIADAMVRHAPPLTAVLPALLEFVGDAVIVGHNVRFDVGFLQAALERHDYPPLDAPAVDTLPLARRLLSGEVPNHRLGTLAAALDLPHQPSHRALADALATADLLHVLLERAGGFGVAALDDLLSLPTAAGHPDAAKLALTARLPRSGGVYLFRSSTGRVLYVGKAANLRARTRSYFTTDRRRKVGPLLAQTARIDFKRCASPIEAEVIELRLIRACNPEFNRAGKSVGKRYYVRFEPSSITGGPRRLVLGTAAATPGIAAIGPLAGRSTGQALVDAIRASNVSTDDLADCLLRGVASPSGSSTERSSRTDVGVVRDRAPDDTSDAEALVAQALETQMRRAATAERFETAARLRDHLVAWTEQFARTRRLARVRAAGVVDLDWRPPDRPGRALRIDHGVLVAAAPLGDEAGTSAGVPAGGPKAAAGARQLALESHEQAWDWHPVEAAPVPPGKPEKGPTDPAIEDELLLVAKWLERHEAHLKITAITGEWTPATTPSTAISAPRPQRISKSSSTDQRPTNGRRRGARTGRRYAPPGQARR